MIINKEYFKKYSPIPLNYNLDEVMLYIPVAEKIWIKPITGPYLFDDIEYQIKNNQVSPEVSTLLTEGGLWQYLCYATVYECLPLLWGKISEVGIVKGKSDNSDSLDLKDMTYIESHIRRQVEVLKEQVLQFLCEHCESYETFNPSICGCNCKCNQKNDLIPPNPSYNLYSTMHRRTELI